MVSCFERSLVYYFLLAASHGLRDMYAPAFHRCSSPRVSTLSALRIRRMLTYNADERARTWVTVAAAWRRVVDIPCSCPLLNRLNHKRFRVVMEIVRCHRIQYCDALANPFLASFRWLCHGLFPARENRSYLHYSYRLTSLPGFGNGRLPPL